MNHVNTASIDLNLLRALHALLANNSVTLAAETLGITQPAASSALKRLRHAFDDPLLVRAGRVLVRTPRAEELVEPLDEAMRAIERLFRAPEPVAPETLTGTLRVATSDHVDLVLFPQLDAVLAREAPQVRLQTLPYSVGVAADLRDGRLDIVIGPHELADADVRHVALFEERFVCVMRQGHPLTERRLTLAAYCRASHVLVSPTGDELGAVDHALAARGRRRQTARVIPQFAAALLTVSASDHVVTLPERLADRLLVPLQLEKRPLPLSVPPVVIRASWHRRQHADPRAAWLRGALVRSATTLTSSAGRDL